jgi:hypothetical protein
MSFTIAEVQQLLVKMVCLLEYSFVMQHWKEIKDVYLLTCKSVKVMMFNAIQQYFNYIMAVSFIGGGNQSTRRKPLPCRKSLTNFIT